MTSSDDQDEWLDNKTANRIESERSSRERLRVEHAALFASVSAILFECDPSGINFIDHTDEYDAEAGSIIPRLRECSKERDARRMIHEEFKKWFSDTAGEESRNTDCARKIWALWQTQKLPECQIKIACNVAGDRVGFEINASRVGPLMRSNSVTDGWQVLVLFGDKSLARSGESHSRELNRRGRGGDKA